MSEHQKAGIFFPFYVGDYLSDTLNLTLQQHGAYLLLLCQQWQHGHFSEAEMYAVCRVSDSFLDSASSTRKADDKQAQADLKQTEADWVFPLKRLLKQDPEGLWFSPRCDRERQKYIEKKRVFYERARKGGLAKAEKMRALSTRKADDKQTISTPKAVLLAPKSEVSTSTRGYDPLRVSPPLPDGATAPRGGSSNPSSPGKPAPSKPPARGKQNEIKAKPPKRGPGRIAKGGDDETGTAGARSSAAVGLRGGAGHLKKQSNRPKADFLADPRFEPCHAELLEFWKVLNRDSQSAGNLPWEVRDQAALSALLRAQPEMTVEMFKVWLVNRAHSEGIVFTDPPRNWVSVNLKRYADGPLDRYGKPIKKRREY